MTPPLKTEGVPGRCRARYSMTEPYWMRAAIDGINAFQLLLAAATSIPPAFHPPSNVFGRCVDDSCSTPLALGSLWAFVCAVLLCGIIAARVLDEERFLSRILPV